MLILNLLLLLFLLLLFLLLFLLFYEYFFTVRMCVAAVRLEAHYRHIRTLRSVFAGACYDYVCDNDGTGQCIHT